MENYTFSFSGGFVTGENSTEIILRTIENGAIKFGNGTITIGSAKVAFDGNNAPDDRTIFNLFDVNDVKPTVDFILKQVALLT